MNLYIYLNLLLRIVISVPLVMVIQSNPSYNNGNPLFRESKELLVYKSCSRFKSVLDIESCSHSLLRWWKVWTCKQIGRIIPNKRPGLCWISDRLPLCSLLSLDLLSQFITGRLPLGVHSVLPSFIFNNLKVKDCKIVDILIFFKLWTKANLKMRMSLTNRSWINHVINHVNPGLSFMLFDGCS